MNADVLVIDMTLFIVRLASKTPCLHTLKNKNKKLQYVTGTAHRNILYRLSLYERHKDTISDQGRHKPTGGPGQYPIPGPPPVLDHLPIDINKSPRPPPLPHQKLIRFRPLQKKNFQSFVLLYLLLTTRLIHACCTPCDNVIFLCH